MADPRGTAQAQERVRELVEHVQGLPALPSMLHQINQMVLNPKISAHEVAQVISSDLGLTSRVLRVVNSPYYGFPNRITTITQAIVILGFNTITSIVLSSTVFDLFGRMAKPGKFDRLEFWRHSIGCGAAARVIGRRLGYPILEELFIAGILHDVGKVVLDQFLPDPFVEVLDLVRSKDLLIVEAETRILGATHADVGAWLFEKWNLSRGLVETTRCHHNPALASESSKIAEIIHVSDILVRAIRFGNGGDHKIPVLHDAAWKSLGLREADLDDLLLQTGKEIERSMIFLEFIH